MFHVKRWLIGLCVSGFALACPGEPAPKPIENHIKEWLQAHNRARAAKGVRPLSWNPDLEKHARQWATKLAKDGCKLYHSKGSGWGENLAASFGYGRPKTPAEVVAMWTKEEQWYNYKNNSCKSGKACGHYTQVVWKRSSDVGCWTAKCPGEKSSYVYACNYDPPGNFRGQKPY